MPWPGTCVAWKGREGRKGDGNGCSRVRRETWYWLFVETRFSSCFVPIIIIIITVTNIMTMIINISIVIIE